MIEDPDWNGIVKDDFIFKFLPKDAGQYDPHTFFYTLLDMRSLPISSNISNLTTQKRDDHQEDGSHQIPSPSKE